MLHMIIVLLKVGPVDFFSVGKFVPRLLHHGISTITVVKVVMTTISSLICSSKLKNVMLA